MAKGGQGKGKAKGHSKSSSSRSSYTPPASIVYPSSTKRTVKKTLPYRDSYDMPKLKSLEPTAIKKKTKSVYGRRTKSMVNTAYCMKCRRQVEIKSPKQVVMRNGRPAVSGTCPYCGTKVFRIGK